MISESENTELNLEQFSDSTGKVIKVAAAIHVPHREIIRIDFEDKVEGVDPQEIKQMLTKMIIDIAGGQVVREEKW